MLNEFVARLIHHPTLLDVFGEQLKRISYDDTMIKELVDALLESYSRFYYVNMEYLTEKFPNRPDIYLFMESVVRVGDSLEDYQDEKFALYWVGKYLFNLVMDSIDKVNDPFNRIKEKLFLADSLKDIYENREVNRVKVWDFAAQSEERLSWKDLYKYRLLTGIGRLDEQLKMVDKTLTLFLAPFKRYKSIILSNVSGLGLAQNLSTFHVHFEGNSNMWSTRLDACIAGVEKKRLYADMTDTERERYRKAWAHIAKRNINFYNMEATQYKTGVVEIEHELDRLAQQGKHFQLIVVDYLNLLKPSNGKKNMEDPQMQELNTWDLVNLSKRGYIVVSAAQSKGKALEKENLSASDYGRSVGIMQAATNVVGVNQNPTEHEQGVIRLMPLALRDGEINTKDKMSVVMSLWRMRISREADVILDKLQED